MSIKDVEVVTCRAHSRAVHAVLFALGSLFISNGIILAVAGFAVARFAYDVLSAVAIGALASAFLIAFVPLWRMSLADRRTLSYAVRQCTKCKIVPKT